MHKRYGFTAFELEFTVEEDEDEFVITKNSEYVYVEPSFQKEVKDTKISHIDSTSFKNNENTGKVEQVTTKMKALELESQI